MLTALQFQVEPTVWGWKVTTPPTRLDIQAGAADLIEELARVSGYDRLPETRLPLELPEQKGNRSLELEEKVRDLLADAGLQEVITYALTSAEAEAKDRMSESPTPKHGAPSSFGYGRAGELCATPVTPSRLTARSCGGRSCPAC